MSLGRYFRGVPDSIKQLPPHWQGDMETGFPARIKAVREDGVSLWYLPSDEIEHERDREVAREERLVKIIRDMYRTFKRHGLHGTLEEYEGRMEALGVEVDG